MRKYLASLVFAGCVLGASPVLAAPPVSEARSTEAITTVAVPQVRGPLGLRDKAAMVLVGTALIGLAAAVRRAA
jgi:hypothetical protein